MPRTLPVALAAVGLLAPSAALADSPLGGGPAFTMSVGRGATVGVAGAPISIGAQSMDNRFGVTLSKLVAFASIDLDRVTGEVDGEAYGVRLATVGLGARYYLKGLKVGKAAPYVVGELFTVSPRQDTGDEDTDDAANAVSSFGFAPGFGGEYAFAKSFSLSGEVGLPILRASTDEPVDISATSISFSSNLFLNFYF